MTKGKSPEMAKTIPITQRKGASPRVVLSLGPGQVGTLSDDNLVRGFGEVEIHLHHGVGQPDTAENTRRALEHFRDVLAWEHKCLSRENANRA